MLFFEKEDLAFCISNVIYFKQGYSKTQNYSLKHNALSFRIRADTLIKTPHQCFRPESGSICHFPARLEYQRTANIDELIVVHFECYNFDSEQIDCYHAQSPQKYERLFWEILNCWNRHDPDCQYKCSAIFCRILSELYKDHLTEQPSYRRIAPSLEYMRQNMLKNDFSLQEAAKMSFISDVYFRKLFKDAYKISPKQYVIETRIQYAKSLIHSGCCSLREIAELCGYNDYKHFTTEFKRITSVSPSKYI